MMKRFPKILALACALFLALGTAACTRAQTPPPKLSIVATLFPQFDFARTIAGEHAEVSLLLPPGADSHNFDPRPGDMLRIADADMLIFTGEDMEPWAGRIVAGFEDAEKGPVVVNAAQGIPLLENADHDHDHEEDDHGHDHGPADPHLWLDPTLAARMASNIEKALSGIDPENAEAYAQNAAGLIDQLWALDREIAEAVASGKRSTLAFGGRFAYQYFIERYRLDYITAYESCASDAEPSVRQVLSVIDQVAQMQIPVVFHEEFVDPKVARSIAKETGAQLLLFSTAHNVTREDLESGITYLDIMRQNLANVKAGLN